MGSMKDRWRQGRGRSVLACFVLGTMLTLPMAVRAEPTALPGDKVKAVKLKLAEVAGEPGRWARGEVRLRGDGLKRIFVQGLDVSAPASVQVVGERLDVPVEVTLHRHTWGRAEARGTTGAGGSYRFEGRIFGDLGVGLRSVDGEATRVTVIVWQGEPVPPGFSSVYAAPGTARATAAGMPAPASAESTFSMWAIFAVLVVIAVLLAGLLMRRRGGASAALLLGLSLLVPQPPAGAANDPVATDKPLPDRPADKPVDKDGTKQSNSRKDKPVAADEAAPNPFDVPAHSDWKPPPRDGADEAPKLDGSAMDDESPPDEPAVGDAAEGGSYRDRIAAAEQANRDLAAQVERNRAEIERLRFLLESDRDNEPSPANLPPMPLSCRPPAPETPAGDGVLSPGESEALDDAFDAAWEQFEECKRCYQQPLADFEAQILLYEKLRGIYSGTKKYVTNVITTGDSLAKPHYLLENAWAAQKLDIKVAFAKTGQAYDAKLIELNDKLSLILDRIGECETSVNNNPMWRQTSGLFFHQTMANSYKRSD